jgi:hypothetical protein
MTQRHIIGDSPRAAYDQTILRFLEDESFIDTWGKSPEKAPFIDFLYVYGSDVTIEVTNTEPFDLDLSFSHYVLPQRWNKLLRDYLDREATVKFITEAKSTKRKKDIRIYEAGMNFGTNQYRAYNWGPCLNGATYHQNPSPRLHIFSRASDFCPIGAFDLNLAGALQRQIDPAGGRLVWTIGMAKISMVGVMFWVLANDYRWDSSTRIGRLLDNASHRLENQSAETTRLFKNAARRMERDAGPQFMGDLTEFLGEDLGEYDFPDEDEDETTT